MHGRVKVKTTEQQEREKKAERQAKLKAYRQAMSTILARRSEGYKDDIQLKATAQVLQSNPDITTLWNIRKETLLHLFETDADAETKIDKDKQLNKELELTQSCLMVNPKSYGAWYHRTWSLELMDNPDWSREMALCDRYLKLDERNFHCWDYRKWVASKAQVSCETELGFTMEKIEENFSNYSAWHYRSKLLPLLYPGNTPNSIQESMIHSELDLVQNAAFTDPEDSSAWFYHTWLLGRTEETPSIIFCEFKKDRLIVATTQPVSSDSLKFEVENQERKLDWSQPSEESRNLFSNLWSASNITLENGAKIKVTLSGTDDPDVLEFRMKEEDCMTHGIGWKSSDHRFISLPSEKTKQVLEQALSNCVQLLELEPDSKWTLYTKVLILLALDSQLNHKEILSSLTKLEELDKIHSNFYADLANRLKIEYAIETSDQGELDELVRSMEENKSSVRYHTQYLAAFH